MCNFWVVLAAATAASLSASAALAQSTCLPVSGSLTAEVVALPYDGVPVQLRLAGIVGPQGAGQASTAVITPETGTAEETVVAAGPVPADQVVTISGQIDWLPGTHEVTGYELRVFPVDADGAPCPAQTVDQLSAEEIWSTVIAAVDAAPSQLVALAPQGARL